MTSLFAYFGDNFIAYNNTSL